MKIIDRSPLKPRRGQKQAPWQDRVRAVLKHGWGWYQAYQAEERIITILQGVLDNRFTLIRGFTLPGEEKPLPLVVVGPPGVFLLHVWPKAGFYRIREDQWEVMQRNSRRYRPGKVNMVKVVQDTARRLTAFLTQQSGKQVKVQPLFVFADPGTDVDAVRPAIKPLLMDGLKRYFAQQNQGEAVLTPMDLMRLTDAFSPGALGKQPRPKKHRRKPTAPPKPIRQAERYLNFTPRQWAILGVLAALVLLTSMCAILYVLMTTT